MKKILAVTLGILMLFSVIPTAFAAAPVEYTASDNIIYGDNLNATIKSGVTMTIPDGYDLEIASGETLTVEQGATLVLFGTLRVAKGGNLEIKGTVTHSERVTVLGTAQVYYYFPNTRANALGSHLNSVYAGYSKDGLSYADVNDNVEWSSNLVSGGTFAAPLNTYLYIRTSFKQPLVSGFASIDTSPKSYDDEKLKVFLDGIEMPCRQGVHMTTVTTSSVVSFSDWSDSAYLYDYKFCVPTGSGYTVHGDNGENSAYGAIGIPAGSNFRFRVEIDGSYDMSEYDVYVYQGYSYDNETGEDKIDNGDAVHMIADNDGYYTIENVYSDYTIYVSGVVSNDTIKTASSILDILRNVINVIKTFFERLAGMLGINLA